MASRRTLDIPATPSTVDPFEGIKIDVKRHGEHIILPARPDAMTYDRAISTLERIRDEEEQEVAINEAIDAFPKDGAVAFQRAMQQKFGWVNAVPTPSFFGSNPPTTIDVEIGPDERMSVIWGRFNIPAVDGYVQCDAYPTAQGPRFRITGKVKRKHHPLIVELAELTRKYANDHSIYRGKAISMVVDTDGDIDWHDGIRFIDLRKIDRNELIFSAATEQQIRTSLWTPIMRTAECRAHKIPLKRGVLLEGPYGTGKTMTSRATAILAQEHGWTFLTISRVSGLSQALHFARKFQPCVIFAEDIDRAIEGDRRTVAIDDILNVIDGIGSQNTEIMVVLTTNHIERINRAMIRPGRLDAIVSVTPPDQEAARKLVRLYGRTLIAANDSLDAASAALAGQIPAMIRECVERAKLYAIGRNDSGAKLEVTDQDIVAAAEGMAAHMRLLASPVEKSNTQPSMQEVIEAAVGTSLRNVTSAVEDNASRLGDVMGQVNHISTILDRQAQASRGMDKAEMREIITMLNDVASQNGVRRR